MSMILGYGLRFLFVLPAIVLHEVSHGFVAYLLGDPTAKRAGRLTLNPLKHIDPVGTLLLPAVLLIASGGTFAFGYAKPVPIQPHYFRNYRTGMFLTGIAGPLTNLLLAVVAGVASRFVGDINWLQLGLWYFALVNLALMFFNLIPLPPLDGSRVIPLFLKDSQMHAYHRLEQYGFGILLLLVWGLPAILKIDPLGIYFDYTVTPLMRLITGN